MATALLVVSALAGHPVSARTAQDTPTAQDRPSTTTATAPDARLRDEVWRAEEAFAKSMADRDRQAFAAWLSPEAVFWGADIARGPAAVMAAWAPYFEGPTAPFSWRPETVEVLASGTLAFSSGPVFDPTGRRIGTFNSVWRREADGRWRVVFDKGCPPPPRPQP